MKKKLYTLTLTATFAVVLTVLFAVNVWYFKPVSIELYYYRVFIQFASFKPEKLTEIRVLEPFGITGHNSKLNDYSIAAKREIYAYLRDQREIFLKYPKDNYSGSDLLSYEVFDYYIKNFLEGEPWLLHEFTLNQFYGIHTDLPNFMVYQHYIDSVHAARQYLERLRQFPTAFAQTIASLQESEARGIYPPRFAIEKSLEQMQSLVEIPAEHNDMYRKFMRKLDLLSESELNPVEREELQQQALALINDAVYPAYRQLMAHQRSLLDHVTSNDGVWRLPQGDAYYSYLVRLRTTLDLSPEAIHRIGMEEVARIVAQMDPILKELGYTEGSIGQRLALVATSPGQIYTNADGEWRHQALDDFQHLIDRSADLVAPYFSKMPTARLLVEQIPEYEESTHSSAYYKHPSDDGVRPGKIFLNLKSADHHSRFANPTLAHHEGYPGHHLQSAHAQENLELPLFRRYVPFTAYSEGWAMYAERLAWEVGALPDVMDNLGRLRAEMLRAVRLVVDTGLHSRRWTREQAIHYLREYTGISEEEAVIEIERYLTLPAHALTYTTGMLQILKLRSRAQHALGSAFDLREFHDQILGPGELPLNLLEEHIQHWILHKQNQLQRQSSSHDNRYASGPQT